MPKVIILRGLPASGKTTYAKQMVKKGNYTRVNKDDIRRMLHGSDTSEWGFRKDAEKMVLSIRDSIIIKALRSGNNVIVDDTNLHPKHIDRITEVVEAQQQIDRDYFEKKNLKYTVEIKDFDITLREAIARDQTRSKRVGATQILKMYTDLVLPLKRVTQDENAPQAVIFDLDGTLCDLNGRNPYDASECEYDLPNYPVIDVLRKYVKDGYKIIITSGRKDTWLEQTDNWLKKNGIKPDLFLMRKADDDRPDNELKKEMFMQHIHNKYYVEVAYDDRDRVVDTWREMGISTFQVNWGMF